MALVSINEELRKRVIEDMNFFCFSTINRVAVQDINWTCRLHNVWETRKTVISSRFTAFLLWHRSGRVSIIQRGKRRKAHHRLPFNISVLSIPSDRPFFHLQVILLFNIHLMLHLTLIELCCTCPFQKVAKNCKERSK